MCVFCVIFILVCRVKMKVMVMVMVVVVVEWSLRFVVVAFIAIFTVSSFCLLPVVESVRRR